MILGCVGEAVEEEVDGEEGEAVVGGCLWVLREFPGLGRVVEGEDGDAGGDGEDDEVFGEWVAFLIDEDVEEHDGEEFAGFGEDEGEVVDVGERGIAKRRG